MRYLWIAKAFERAGKRGSFGRNIRFHGDLRIELGEQVAIRDGCQFGGNGTLRVGDRTAINAECILTALDSIEIGSDVMLAPRVYILDVDHRFTDRSIPISKQGYDVAPVTIGDGAWIGTGAVITKGVTIGEGAIVGANSVVTRDIPPFTIAAGLPARPIKKRPK
ncbi:acyltransferase [Roseovarius bejariae]|nr:acyltransferase [Roseovarius bejariae]